MSEFRKGQRVRVTFEAEYVENFTGYHEIKRGNDASHVEHWFIPPDATIEPIEDLRPGDIYRDADDDVAVWLPDGGPRPWLVTYIRRCVRSFNVGERAYDGHMQRPLTLLVRGGQPVIP